MILDDPTMVLLVFYLARDPKIDTKVDSGRVCPEITHKSSSNSIFSEHIGNLHQKRPPNGPWNPFKIMKNLALVSEGAQRRPRTTPGPPKYAKSYQKLPQMVPQSDEKMILWAAILHIVWSVVLENICCNPLYFQTSSDEKQMGTAGVAPQAFSIS